MFFKSADEFSPYRALFPCIGTFLFVTNCSESNIFYKIFSSKWLVVVGILSYSLYLWHFPLIEFFKFIYEPYGLMLQITTVLGIVSLSTLSYKFVELYYRHTKSLLSLSKYCACLVIICYISFVYNLNDMYSDFYKFTSDYTGSCLYHPEDDVLNKFNKEGCTVGTKSYKPNILLVGSSHSNSYVPFFGEFAKQYGFSFINITANSTAYTKEYILGRRFKELENDQNLIKFHSTYYKLASSLESEFDILITCPTWANSEQNIFSKSLEHWSRKFKMVILVSYTAADEKFKLNRRFIQRDFRLTSDENASFVQKEANKYSNVYYISLQNLILEGKGRDNHGHALFFDPGHLNIGGAKYLAKRIIQDSHPHLLKSSKFLDIAKSKKLDIT